MTPSPEIEETHEHTRTSMTVEAMKRAFLDNLFYIQGRFPDVATDHDLYMAAAYTVRDRMLERWIKTAQTYKAAGARTVCYLSAEFLLGPHSSELRITGLTSGSIPTLDYDARYIRRYRRYFLCSSSKRR